MPPVSDCVVALLVDRGQADEGGSDERVPQQLSPVENADVQLLVLECFGQLVLLAEVEVVSPESRRAGGHVLPRLAPFVGVHRGRGDLHLHHSVVQRVECGGLFHEHVQEILSQLQVELCHYI